MKLALLYILLTTGESGVEVLDADVCQRVPQELARGLDVSVDTADGRDRVRIAAAACFDLEPVGDCGDDA